MKKRASAADLLGAALRQKGVSQAELARRTGLSPKGVSFLVRGRHGFSPRTAALCQRALEDERLARRILVAQARQAAAAAVEQVERVGQACTCSTDSR